MLLVNPAKEAQHEIDSACPVSRCNSRQAARYDGERAMQSEALHLYRDIRDSLPRQNNIAKTTASLTMANSIPQIHLLCMEERFIDAFEAARQSRKLPSSVPIKIHDCALSQLPSSVQFDTIVSPANSYQDVYPRVQRHADAIMKN
ncbi:hypothetical protein NM208_g1297 [Fusarium decemcellulare]|uniref:Uncharacterized protein n=1 Tax=Fusarium decemcellulare TaxID=57161 RepID=A0ACC1SX72_9HYPO|nr:hypothetical protein NM208_g1297 [Fusarium decemcellulare]